MDLVHRGMENITRAYVCLILTARLWKCSYQKEMQSRKKNMAELLLSLASSLPNSHCHRVLRGRKSHPAPPFDETWLLLPEIRPLHPAGRTCHKRLVIPRKGYKTRQLVRCWQRGQLYVQFKVHNSDFVLNFTILHAYQFHKLRTFLASKWPHWIDAA